MVHQYFQLHALVTVQTVPEITNHLQCSLLVFRLRKSLVGLSREAIIFSLLYRFRRPRTSVALFGVFELLFRYRRASALFLVSGELLDLSDGLEYIQI